MIKWLLCPDQPKDILWSDYVILCFGINNLKSNVAELMFSKVKKNKITLLEAVDVFKNLIPTSKTCNYSEWDFNSIMVFEAFCISLKFR